MSRTSRNYKKLNLPFRDMIPAKPLPITDRIMDGVKRCAERFITAVKADGTADAVAEIMAASPDHYAAPDRKIRSNSRTS